MSRAPAGRERRYRRLLWAYPADYRRRHGAEIVTTMIDLAEARHGRLSVGQTLHLVACGVRQRFRLPAGRPLTLVAAVLAALALGALGAAGGTWLGWQTAASLPSNDDIRALTAAITGGDPSRANVYPWHTAMNGPAVSATATGQGSFTGERIRSALASAGWQFTGVTETVGGVVVDITKDPTLQTPARFMRFTATKDGLWLEADGFTLSGLGGGPDARYQRLTVWAVDTGAVRPMAIAGLLLGMLAGWLLTAACAYRLRRGDRRDRTVAVLTGMVIAAAVVPAFALYGNLYEVMRYNTGNPSPYIVYGASGQLPRGLIPACAGIALVAALVVVRRTRVSVSAAPPPHP
jgi:hypothetical protein